MRNKDIEERFNDLSDSNVIKCTLEEFENFQAYGYLIQTGNTYLTKLGKKVTVELINMNVQSMNIDLTNVIDVAIDVSKKIKYKRIYCMSNDTFSKYCDRGCIITLENNNYYKTINNELWYVKIF